MTSGISKALRWAPGKEGRRKVVPILMQRDVSSCLSPDPFLCSVKRVIFFNLGGVSLFPFVWDRRNWRRLERRVLLKWWRLGTETAPLAHCCRPPSSSPSPKRLLFCPLHCSPTLLNDAEHPLPPPSSSSARRPRHEPVTPLLAPSTVRHHHTQNSSPIILFQVPGR